MKLYTEQQVKTIIGKAQMLDWDDKFLFSEDYLIKSETAIELPIDDEIYNEASNWVFRKNPMKWSTNDDTAGDNMGSFINGAKWMRNKILNLKSE